MKNTAPEIDLDALSAISETLLLPLYCRAIESDAAQPVLTDPKAVAIVAQLDQAFARSQRRLHRKLVARQLPSKLTLTMALRTRRFDRYAQDFLQHSPDGAIVSLGCGLDTRFERVDNGRAQWIELDLPAVMDWRRRLFDETPRRRFVACSVTDHSWLEQLAPYRERPLLFLAEGLFMYLEPGSMKTLVLELQRQFPGSELVAEVIHARWVTRMRSRFIKYKFQKQLHLADGATFQSGIDGAREPELWSPGIQLVDEWTYFDDGEPRLGWLLGLLGRFDSARQIQWTVHYRLSAAT